MDKSKDSTFFHRITLILMSLFPKIWLWSSLTKVIIIKLSLPWKLIYKRTLLTVKAGESSAESFNRMIKTKNPSPALQIVLNTTLITWIAFLAWVYHALTFWMKSKPWTILRGGLFSTLNIKWKKYKALSLKIWLTNQPTKYRTSKRSTTTLSVLLTKPQVSILTILSFSYSLYNIVCLSSLILHQEIIRSRYWSFQSCAHTRPN